MPDLRGRTAQAGSEQLAAIGIGSSTTPVYDDVAPEGQVVDTRPAPGDTVHKNGSVVLVVSAGPELFALPDLRGLTQDEAVAALQEDGMALGAVTEAYDPQVPAGQVVSADPPAGSEVRAGTPVAVVLSLGPEPVAVPGVTGVGVDEARAALEAVGLRLGEQGEDFADAPAGTVVTQAPAEGTLLPGDAVDVVVSLGPEPVEVPAVFEQRFDDAAAALEELGFVVERRGSGHLRPRGQPGPLRGDPAPARLDRGADDLLTDRGPGQPPALRRRGPRTARRTPARGRRRPRPGA